ARFGRFGSPYACEDLTAVDPALVEFDQRTTGVEQFCELTYEAHRRRAKVLLDVVINHTGWGSTLWETHPKWFLRDAKGNFASPGAWGTVWADLVELDPNFTELWEHFADAFLTWCRRGVDGFRCDAGYKVPLPVWQYIEARVREEFPETLFLLEGLGGPWAATESLLTEGGMQWAYSEVFQNYSAREVASYLDYSLRQSERVGVYVHYSETHDNERLAKKGRAWSLMRNRLCALTSVCGGYGFTCGTEWLADEQIQVHQSRGMAWGGKENIVGEIAQLNQLLSNHPCFFDGATLARLSALDSPILALSRKSAEGKDSVLILINNDVEKAQTFLLEEKIFRELGEPRIDLLDQPPIQFAQAKDGSASFSLAAGGACCLAVTPTPAGQTGESYRRARAQAAWALSALSKVMSPEKIGARDWRELAAQVDASPKQFLSEISHLPAASRVGAHNFSKSNDELKSPAPSREEETSFPQVVTWTLLDRRRITPIPPDHWLLLCDSVPFRATLGAKDSAVLEHASSIEVASGHVAFFAPRKIDSAHDMVLALERYAPADQQLEASVRFLTPSATFQTTLPAPPADALVLLTNGLGGMARMCVDLGRINSKYDCVLGANRNENFPTDRHVFVKRVRVWLNADGFVTQLSAQNLVSIQPGPPAIWQFSAKVGDQRVANIELTADMLDGKNTTVLRFQSSSSKREAALVAAKANSGKRRPGSAATEAISITLIVRVDIEDRNFHSETHRNSGAEHHFQSNSKPLTDKSGFVFSPAADRQLRVYSDSGFYHHEAEWSDNIPHPIEQNRGQVGAGDAFSPGWFKLPFAKNKSVSLVLCADTVDPTRELVQEIAANRLVENKLALNRAKFPEADSFGRQLTLAARQFVVKRGSGKTVIAGYPWFLDWGRDSLIAARGLLAAGLVSDVTELLMTFGRFV
ncbi:MAG: glycogen debranching enzyme N-terminal domain-containing protein, partial [Verrucomicrobiota bacterium]